MQIETKFKIGDLINHKYESTGSNVKHAMEVIYINTQTCSAGTQVFYECRHIEAKKLFKGYKEEGEFTWLVGHATSSDNNKQGLTKYREDEIIAADEEAISIITGNKV